MSALTLTKTHFRSSVWEGIIRGVSTRPEIIVTHLDRAVPDVRLIEGDVAGEWHLAIPIPPEAIGDGVQSFLICEAGSGETLGSFTLIAGDPLADDIRAEVELLRAELDMLKRTFRRHCLETQ